MRLLRITLSVSTLCDQVALEADLLEPIYERIRKEMLERPWIQADETPVLYVSGKGRGKKTKRSSVGVRVEFALRSRIMPPHPKPFQG